MKPRVAIIDDHTLFGIALGKLLESSCQVVGSYNEVLPFLAEVPRLKPDIAILDVRMPSMSGLQAAREIQKLVPKTRIIFLTADEDPVVAAEGIGLGAAAYLLKSSTGSELPLAIREVMKNRRYITPSLRGDPTIRGRRDLIATPRKSSRLTPRQWEVLRLIAGGRSMKEAAAILNVSTRTVAFHKYRIMKHLNITSTAALIQFAMREGVI
jgi:DNA-binding NarL/FixJ family response regulator